MTAIERGSVLVAEDDPEMRTLLASWLRENGFRVREAENGAAAIALFIDREESVELPDVVVTDIRMPPGPSGLDVLHYLRLHMPDIPVILITAFGEVGTHRRARELGARAILDKPFELERLQACIDEALAGRGRRSPS